MRPLTTDERVWVRKWIEALRSGKYKQGKSRLRTDGNDDSKPEFCCIGVACEIVDGFLYDPTAGGLSRYLEHPLHDLLIDARYTEMFDNLQGALIRHNDALGTAFVEHKDFNQIADLLEELF